VRCWFLLPLRDKGLQPVIAADLYAKRGASFGFETTLSGRSYLSLIRRLKRREYEVHVFYLWVPSVELALLRIRGRVSLGGHDVPAADVRRRFDRSIRNFLVHYRHPANSWTLYDNTAAMPKIIASEERGQLQIGETALYNDLVRRYGKP
jgi:predicted ABC-type ATPase